MRLKASPALKGLMPCSFIAVEGNLPDDIEYAEETDASSLVSICQIILVENILFSIAY